MIELSMHIIDIVENSARAGADTVAICIEENMSEDRLYIQILDNGAGMDEEMVKTALDPFITTKEKKRVGLGLSMLREAARKAEGDVTVRSVPGEGTLVEAVFSLSHVDRQPLGNLREMMVCLLAAHPQVDFQVQYSRGENEFEWHSKRIQEVMGETLRTRPAVMKFIRRELDGLHILQNVT